jgi:N-acyl-D-aspartate/D-glutamate deacylase
MLVDIAAERGMSPFDALAELVLDPGARTKLTLGAVDETEMRALLEQPWMMVASDGRESGVEEGRGHPRYRGSFARILGRYVRDEHVLTLPEAVHKMSGQPAAYLQLADRGVIRSGAVADLSVFDFATVRDRSTWDRPELYAEGFHHVLVNGTPALLDGAPTGALAGRFLTYAGRPGVPAK